MVEPDRDEHEPEQLSGGDSPRVNWPAAAVVVVLIVGAVLLARAAHHASRPAASRHPQTSSPAPSPAAPSPQVHVGSVFLERLCARTDHQHFLAMALGVTNLSAHRLVLLGATGVSSDDRLVQPLDSVAGSQGCGAQRVTAKPVRLAPGDAARVAVTFRIGTACPRQAFVSARVSFDGGRFGVVHADYSELALAPMTFVQCA